MIQKLTPQRMAWVTLAEKKNELINSLQKKELELQTVNDIDVYKKKFKEMKDERLSFTSALEKAVISPLMEFEKRADPKTNERALAMARQDIDERKRKEDEITSQQIIANEIAEFKCHFIDEYHRIAAKFRADAINLFNKNGSYDLNSLKLDSPKKFDIKYLTKEAAFELFNSIRKIDETALRYEVRNMLLNKDIQEINTIESAATIAAEKIIIKSEATVIIEDKFKAVKTIKQIKIKDDDKLWVETILICFFSNFDVVFDKIKVKNYSQITIAQMSAALDAAKIKVEDVEYEIIEK